jgi:hypothetical protein
MNTPTDGEQRALARLAQVADDAVGAGHRGGDGGRVERAIMAQTGHKSLPMVTRYIRDGALFRRNAAAAVGL